jgi:hypothetical protein
MIRYLDRDVEKLPEGKGHSRPPRMSGVASSVRPTAVVFPKAPSYRAIYAVRGFAPDSHRMTPPITRANTTEVRGMLTERHDCRRMVNAVERPDCEFCGMIAEILLAAG